MPGMGPKTVALVWSALGVSDMDGLEAAAREGKLAELPRMGERFTDKLLKGIEDYRRNSGRFRIDQALEQAERISALIREFPGIDEITPAGSLRRGRETVGDLDLLATGPACEPDVVALAVEHVAIAPTHRQAARPRAEQSQLHPPQQLPGRRAAAPTRQLRGRAPVLHRLEDAQRRLAAARDQARLHAVASTRCFAWKTTPSLPPPAKRRSIARSSSTTFLLSCAKTAANSKPPPHTEPSQL